MQIWDVGSFVNILQRAITYHPHKFLRKTNIVAKWGRRWVNLFGLNNPYQPKLVSDTIYTACWVLVFLILFF